MTEAEDTDDMVNDLILSLEEPMSSAKVRDEGPWSRPMTSVEPLEQTLRLPNRTHCDCEDDH